MAIEVLIAFLIACLVFSSTPGVGILSTVNHAVSTSKKYTAYSIFGLELALAIYVLVVGVGLNAILVESILMFTIIKWCGVVYLVWLGVEKLLETSSLPDSPDSNIQGSPYNAIKAGMLVNFSNPKSIIFLAAFFPQFIDPNENVTQQYLILGATMIFVDAMFHVLYAILASKVKKYISSERSLFAINKVFGFLFISAGLLMARVNKIDA